MALAGELVQRCILYSQNVDFIREQPRLLMTRVQEYVLVRVIWSSVAAGPHNKKDPQIPTDVAQRQPTNSDVPTDSKSMTVCLYDPPQDGLRPVLKMDVARVRLCYGNEQQFETDNIEPLLVPARIATCLTTILHSA